MTSASLSGWPAAICALWIAERARRIVDLRRSPAAPARIASFRSFIKRSSIVIVLCSSHRKRGLKPTGSLTDQGRLSTAPPRSGLRSHRF